MKVTTVKEFKVHATQYMKSSEPILITRRGKVAGFFVPVEDPAKLPFDIRRQLLLSLCAELNRKAKGKGLTEEKALAKFAEFRQARRGC